MESISGSGNELTADTSQRCPSCNRQLFRTDVSVKVVPAKDQTRKLVPGKDYDIADMEYE